MGRLGGFIRLGALMLACVAIVACAGRSSSELGRDAAAGMGATSVGGMKGGGGSAGGVNGGGGGVSVGGCSRRILPRQLGDGCGDGVHDDGEECDDGNRTARDGCTVACQVEADAVCPQVGPCVLDPCGNGHVSSYESCDDGNTVDGDGCAANCELESGWYCPAAGLRCRPYCGDAAVTGDEECDDGNPLGGDGCSRTCRVEHPVCDVGAGAAGAGGAANDEPPGASGTCRVACIVPTCGDGVVTAPEDCDDGVRDGSYGGCNPDCTFADYCGDGIVSADEECDPGPLAEGYGEGECTAACRVAPYCGDGLIDAAWGEQCDVGPIACGGCTACRVIAL